MSYTYFFSLFPHLFIRKIEQLLIGMTLMLFNYWIVLFTKDLTAIISVWFLKYLVLIYWRLSNDIITKGYVCELQQKKTYIINLDSNEPLQKISKASSNRTGLSTPNLWSDSYGFKARKCTSLLIRRRNSRYCEQWLIDQKLAFFW